MAADRLRAPPWRRKHDLVARLAGANVVQCRMDVVAKDHQRIHASQGRLHLLRAPSISEHCKCLERRETVHAHISRSALTAERSAYCLFTCDFLFLVTTHGADLEVGELTCAAEPSEDGQRCQGGRLSRWRDCKGLRRPQRVDPHHESENQRRELATSRRSHGKLTSQISCSRSAGAGTAVRHLHTRREEEVGSVRRSRGVGRLEGANRKVHESARGKHPLLTSPRYRNLCLGALRGCT